MSFARAAMVQYLSGCCAGECRQQMSLEITRERKLMENNTR